MITGNENLQQIIEIDKNFIPFFEKHGLGNYFKPENLAKIGKYTRLNSLLISKKIEPGSFIATLNGLMSCSAQNKGDGSFHQEQLHFSAMLPCGLRNPFKEYFEAVVNGNIEPFADLNFLIEGNVNHELSYYPLLDSIAEINELPDVIIASDVNNFFHRPFISRFIEKGIFSTYAPYKPNNYLEKDGFADPNGNFTMFTSNLLVMVVDKQRLGNRPLPKIWNDLLDSNFRNDIVMRGEDDFFCNAVMLPFYKDGGKAAIEILAQNIKGGLHPAEMVKLAGTQKTGAATVYIMPYFFAKRIQNKQVEIVWPEDGAIVSPVFMLVKKEKIEKHQFLLDFLLSKETGELFTGRCFPSIHPEVSNEAFPDPVKWLGWDFLNTHDIGALKDDIRDTFMKVWNAKKKQV
jgi:ABC-type Fe3+ transport system substrate-binding protein